MADKGKAPAAEEILSLETANIIRQLETLAADVQSLSIDVRREFNLRRTRDTSQPTRREHAPVRVPGARRGGGLDRQRRRNPLTPLELSDSEDENPYHGEFGLDPSDVELDVFLILLTCIGILVCAIVVGLTFQDDVVSYRTILSNAWVRYNNRLDEQSVLAEVLCLHRGVVKKEVAVLCRRKEEGSLPSPRSGEKGSVAVLCRRKEEGSLPSPRSGEKGSVAVLCRRKEEGSLPSPRSGEKGSVAVLCRREMASSSKRSKVTKGSSRNENFLSKDNETAYGKYSASKITPSRILIQSDIDFQILPLFSSTQLSFILTLSHSYHKEMFLQFLSNLRVTPECTRLTSFVMQQKVIIDKEDLGTFLHLRTEGDRLHTLIQDADISWSLVNDTLRGNKDKVHQPRVYTLLQNARIIQHVLRSSIIPKAGDRVNITPLLSLVTHLIMTNTPFDEAQLILDYIHRLSDIRHPQTKRKKNIALGHLVCYILEKKYNLIYPEPPTEEPIFFTNASFRSLFHDPSVEGEDSEGDKEAPSEPAPVPNQNAFNDIIQRFDTMETNFGQRFDQIDLHMKTQEDRHNLDMAWIRGQTDYINQNVAIINSYFTAFNPQPPPDQDPEG
ncbi:hypothetical protein M5K25_027809 [Dendrobium thyrsiflorum]|uniref:Uncharacterized protein n=1 Tax=Dendrobium thyrsiflorum TaxID=117978 RepID=A0ABD0TUR5_DENTH